MKRLDLEPLLDHLRDIGYEHLYRPQRPSRPAAEASAEAAPATGGSDAAARADDGGRGEALRLLSEEASGCTACVLSETRNKVVFGSGSPVADLMFIGEGPGANEDRQGLPFVGAAGELLTRMIQAIDLQRDEVYIANVVKCRPPGNRDPRPEEVAACSSYLRGQIELIRPRILVALGRVAAQALLDCTTPVGRLRGQWHEVAGVPLRVTYHPAALLRNAGLKRPAWEDLQVVRDRLRAPVAAGD